jgi:MoaA/NifB/PqqE/SkfB family radical SAM enzyme
MMVPFLRQGLSFLRKTPYCTAPFTSLTVDPDKGVRPCCTFDGVLGNLRDTPLRDILRGPQWRKVQADVASDALPDGCVSCYEREKATGWSNRISFTQARATRNGQWRKGLTDIEINSSNVCNLACTHCSVDFSSRWAHLVAQLEEEKVPHYRRAGALLHKPDPEGMVRHLSALDLRHLDVARFKGGEPMLNPDVPAVLRYLEDKSILPRVKVSFVTNGSVVNEEVLRLLRRAESVEMCISVDGMGKVQEYIRHGPSGIPRIERFIAAFSSLERIEFNLSISIMVYNVFSLDRISRWWNAFRDTYPGKMRYPLSFHLEVVNPAILAVNVLQDASRSRLIEKYQGLSDADYDSVVLALKQPFAGVQIHNDFVAYTRGLDKIWKADVLDAVPELADEMKLLGADSGDALADDPNADIIRKGVSLSQAGAYEEVLRLYHAYLGARQVSLAKSWPIRLHLAIVLGKMDKWDESLAELDRIVRQNPSQILTALQRAERGGNGSFLPRVSEAVNREIGAAETPPFRLVLASLAHRALDQRQEAAERLDQALEQDPGFMLAKVARGDGPPAARA